MCYYIHAVYVCCIYDDTQTCEQQNKNGCKIIRTPCDELRGVCVEETGIYTALIESCLKQYS